MTRPRRAATVRGLGSRLLLAQTVVLLASIATAGLVASLVGPPLFHEHLLRAGRTATGPELDHIEQAYSAASLVSLGVALLVALGCAGTVTWYLSRRLQGPLTALTNAASRMAAGHYEVRLPEAGAGSELDSLAKAFNLMAARLGTVEDTRRRLLADLAHELRTPIATLAAYTDALTDGLARWDETTAGVVGDQITRLTRLTGDVAEVSRAQEGRIDLHLESQTVDELLVAAVEAAREAYARKGVALAIAGKAPFTVNVDSDRLGQVLANLLANALRHSPKGSKVTLTARSLPDEVEIDVTDTGEGIAVDQLGPIFERFYRGDTGRDRDHGGTGIGLTISRALVGAHGGTLSATSAGAGRGATFAIRLPVPRVARVG